MDDSRTEVLKHKLDRRRTQLSITLQHLENEQKEVGEYNGALDHGTRERRVRLLEKLTAWYVNEMARIERALRRMDSLAYGLCGVCRQPIEPQRLATLPESELCASCHSRDFRKVNYLI